MRPAMVSLRHSANSISPLGTPLNGNPTLLLALIISGYPVAAVIVTILGLESTAVTIPYRIIVGMLSLLLLFTFVNKRGRLYIAMPFLLFGLVYLLRLIVDYINLDDVNRGFILLYFISAVLLPGIAIAAVGAQNVKERTLAYWVIGFAFVLLVGVIAGTQEIAVATDLGGTRLSIDALNPIALGNAAGSGVIAAAWLALNVETKSWQKLLFSIPIVLFMYVLILAASRGPLISLIFAIAWLLLSRIRYFLWVGPLAIISFAIYLPQTLMYERIFGSTGGISSADENIFLRFEYQWAAFEQFTANPFFGDVATLIAYGPLIYPHNIFVEVLMAMGALGLFIFFWLMLRCVVIFSASKSRNEFLLLKLIFIQYFVAAQFSGSLWGSGQVWAMIGLLTSHQTYRFLRSGGSLTRQKVRPFGGRPAPLSKI